jgi:hypothetical protein
MEGSTGNGSGASSSVHPPSLYDTSVSSASAGKSGWRNTIPAHRSYSEREELQYTLHNQHPNEYQHQERGHHTMYSKSPRSMDNSEYKYNRDIAAMSDPGGMQVTRSERNLGQRRSHIEYARSEIALPSSYYYEPQQRLRESPRHLQEERHKETKPRYSQNRYSSAPTRTKSRSPPSEHQHREAHFRLQQNNVRANEGYDDGMYATSPSYNERSLDSSSSTSGIHVKELQRQLWNNHAVLKKHVPSSPKDYRRIKQSVSPTRQPRRQGPTTPSNNHPRFAKSLSPRRRQYEHSSPMVGEAHSLIREADSTISETSYNNRFHSKFYQAALVAQKRVDGKTVAENEVEESQKQTQQYQQQQYQQQLQNERRWQSSSSRPLNEGDSNQYPHQNLRGNNSVPSSSLLPNTSNRINKAGHYRKNDSGVNMSMRKAGNSAHRPPIIYPSPSSSTSPTAMNDERQERHQLRQTMSADRGRSKDLPQFRRGDSRSARRIRPPSPNLLERIKSFDHDYQYDSAHGISEGREQGYKSAVDRHDGHPSNDNWRGMNHHDNGNGNNGHEVVGGSNTSRRFVVNEENIRSPRIAGATNGRFHNDGNNFDHGKGHSSDVITTDINAQNMQGASHPNQQVYQSEGSHDNADQIRKDRMANLVDKLSAINRENPKSALAQIDSILRQESRSSHPQAFENIDDVGGTSNDKMQSHDNYPAESNFTGREYEDDERKDVTSNNEADDDDDDSSDVSAITNPTFQQGTSSSKQMEPLYIRENDHYNMHNTSQNSDLGERNGDFDKLLFNPSTSSFRRPRPSHLQNYSKDLSKDSNAMSRSELKRQQLKKIPPPSTIIVKDDPVKSENPRQNSADFREKMLQKNMNVEASRANNYDKVSREQETSMNIHDKPKKKLDKPKKKLDKSIADKQCLAQKIRGWDQLSNQLSTSRSEQEESIKGYQSVEAFSKQHPWNSNINMVQTKDTSMDDAIGIEAEMSTSGHHYDSNTYRHDTEAETSMEGSRISNEVHGNHFKEARKNIKYRTASDHRNANLMPNIDISMTGIPQFNPSERQQFINEGKVHNAKKSESEGNSWVAMPPSSFFPDIDDDFEPIISKKSRKSSDLSDLLGTSGQYGGINQVSAGVNKLKMQDEDGDSESRSITRLSCKTIGNKEPKVKEKKRGFLRTFMEKKKTKASGLGYAASAAAGSVSGHSTSVESRGVKSASQLHYNSRPSSTQPISNMNFHILPPPPGVLHPTNTSIDKKNVRSRAGYRSASAPRHRSSSSEKFRSRSMAQKFNRVMQLYDSDEA